MSRWRMQIRISGGTLTNSKEMIRHQQGSNCMLCVYNIYSIDKTKENHFFQANLGLQEATTYSMNLYGIYGGWDGI